MRIFGRDKDGSVKPLDIDSKDTIGRLLTSTKDLDNASPKKTTIANQLSPVTETLSTESSADVNQEDMLYLELRKVGGLRIYIQTLSGERISFDV